MYYSDFLQQSYFGWEADFVAHPLVAYIESDTESVCGVVGSNMWSWVQRRSDRH